ncbi:hypothetical protein [Bradyrhizobium sp. SZCCHNS3004]|uniref:hypothetical protein n=1 Tax=Bradyrhizobium sp. SZCCHNS3004 TaxID=3057312 RepID=UPI0029161D11|nr:hypothetical protein [Bradyrhizobium sp. SZCCHNS3004]
MDTDSSDWLTQVEFAKRFGEHVRGRPYNRHTLIYWIRRKEGPPHVKVGRDVVYSWSAALAWLKEQSNRSTQPKPPRSLRRAA